MSDADLARARVRQLIGLTRRLGDRLSAETEALETHRPRDIAAGLAETQEMANLYRRDTAQVKADPGLLSAAPAADKRELADATRTFDDILNRHARCSVGAIMPSVPCSSLSRPASPSTPNVLSLCTCPLRTRAHCPSGVYPSLMRRVCWNCYALKASSNSVSN